MIWANPAKCGNIREIRQNAATSGKIRPPQKNPAKFRQRLRKIRLKSGYNPAKIRHECNPAKIRQHPGKSGQNPAGGGNYR
jgi:hypothetical protein